MGALALYALIVTGIAMAGCHLVEGVVRAFGREARWVWLAGIVISATLVALAPFRGESPAPTSLLASGDWPGVGAVEGSLPSPGASAAPRLGAPLERVLERVPTAAHLPLAISWGLLSTTLLAVVGWTLATSAAARRRWPRTEVEGYRVRIAEDAGPMAAGLLRPEIVVPRWFMAESPGRRALALRHEREHVVRRDPLLLAVAATLTSALAISPAAWWMLSRLRLAVEIDCDRRVLRRGTDVYAYGTMLLATAGMRAPASTVGTAALGGTRSHLERRLRAMTPKRSFWKLAMYPLVLPLVFLAMLSACEATLPSAAEIEALDGAEAVRRVGQVVAQESEVHFFLDGEATPRSTIEALPASEIASVEVTRMRGDASGDVPSGPAVIQVTRTAAAAGAARVGRSRETETGAFLEESLARPDAAPGAEIQIGSMLAPDDAHGLEPMIIVDGVVTDRAVMAGISPDRIASVEVLKGGAAAAVYGESGRAGVIRIQTRGGAQP